MFASNVATKRDKFLATGNGIEPGAHSVRYQGTPSVAVNSIGRHVKWDVFSWRNCFCTVSATHQVVLYSTLGDSITFNMPLARLTFFFYEAIRCADLVGKSCTPDVVE